MAKTVIITGASRGIGAAAAQEFAEQGWRVIGTTTQDIKGDKVQNDLYQLNLSDEQSISTFCDLLSDQDIVPDCLINNAGINGDQTAPNFTKDDLHAVMQVNLMGTVLLTEILVSRMPIGSRVIMVGSHAGNIHRESIAGNMVPYRLSKAALSMYTRTLATRLKDKKFIITELYPGWVKTDMGSPQAPKEPTAVATELYHLATENIPSDTLWDAGNIIPW